VIRAAFALAAAAVLWAAVSLSALADDARPDCITVETARADFTRWGLAMVIERKGDEAPLLARVLIEPNDTIDFDDTGAVQVWADGAKLEAHVLLFDRRPCFRERAVGPLGWVLHLVRGFEGGGT